MAAKMFKATVFLMLLVIYGINFADSEPVNCKEIQCPPPEIIENCPDDSTLTDKFDLITTLLTTITTTSTTTPTTTTSSTTTPTPTTTTTTLKTAMPEMISVKEMLYDDENSSETDSLEMTDNSITYQYSTKLNEINKNDTTNNSVSTENNPKETLPLIKSTISSSATDSTSSNNTTDSTITNSTNDKTKKPRKHRKKPMKDRKIKSTTEKTDEPTSTAEPNISEASTLEHVIEKRSLRSYQRESIKIVPGGYISYEPQVLHYRQYNHHKWKRNALPEPIEMKKNFGNFVSTKLPTIYQRQVCCPKKECTCKENGCIKPMCVNSTFVLVEIKSGSNVPGKCCPQYECIETEPECLDDSGVGTPYWISKCEKCQCIHGTKICNDGCPPPVKPRNCYSNSLQKSIPHGLTWKEDDCATCECVDGRMDCLTTFCKSPNCKKEIKIPGQCCRVCEEDIFPSTTTISPALATQNTTLLSTENNTNTLITTSVPIVTTLPPENSESDSIFRVISENLIIVILLGCVAGLFIIAICYFAVKFILKKCKQRVYEPVKKSESTNSSQTQEKPIGLKSSSSQ